MSRLSFMECRVLPLRKKQAATLELYRDFFTAPGLRIVELDVSVREPRHDDPCRN